MIQHPTENLQLTIPIQNLFCILQLIGRDVDFMKTHIATYSAILLAELKLALSANLTGAGLDWVTMAGCQNIANIFREAIVQKILS